jgi:glycosyltransferase involved in cell wall biosynthesis
MRSAVHAGPAPDWSTWAACTIASRGELSEARACCRSFLAHHPGARAFVLLADAPEGPPPRGEPFEMLTPADVGLAHVEDAAFGHGLPGLRMALRPFLFQELLGRGLGTLVCLDRRGLVYGPFLEVDEALQERCALLTPHALAPAPDDGRRWSERDLLLAGAYNLGFLALRGGPAAGGLLSWWEDKQRRRAFTEPSLTDQRWMDLVPSLFECVGLLRHPGYNAAHWNLRERLDLAPSPGGGYLVCGQPLRFFQFSGFDPRAPEVLSSEQDRHNLRDLGPHYRTLFAGYARLLEQEGWSATDRPEPFTSFDNGARVPEVARRLWREMGPDRRRFGDPFQARDAGSFFRWLVTPDDPERVLSPLLRALRSSRQDLTAAFPDPEGEDRTRYLEWIVGHHEEDFDLGDPYSGIFRDALARARQRQRDRAPTPAASGLPTEDPAPVAPAADEGPATTPFKKWAAALVGEERYRRWRRDIVWPLYSRLRGRGRPDPPLPRPHARGGGRPGEPRVETAAWQARPFGVNLLGYLDTESGVGETGRGFAALLQAGGVPHALLNIEQSWLRRGDRRLRGFTHARPYAINLVVANPDQLPAIYRQFGLRRGAAYDVGFWAWELPAFPRALFGEALGLVDEIWTHSEFCRRAFATASTVPVEKVVPALVFDPPPSRNRAEFDLGEAFTFLFVYDAASVVKRKNPGAAVAAFRRAFSSRDPVQLVLKTTNASPAHLRALRRLAGGSRVQVLNGYWSRERVVRLIGACDAYVSLHRSEGLGLTLIEALMMGKPVVATRYSGVTEFLEGPGTFPVAFAERPLRRDHGPYARGNMWAEPDVADAARQMRAAYESRVVADGPAVDTGAVHRRRYGIEGTMPAFRARLAAIKERLAAQGALTTG